MFTGTSPQPPACPVCPGWGMPLGQLGRLRWYRCAIAASTSTCARRRRRARPSSQPGGCHERTRPDPSARARGAARRAVDLAPLTGHAPTSAGGPVVRECLSDADRGLRLRGRAALRHAAGSRPRPTCSSWPSARGSSGSSSTCTARRSKASNASRIQGHGAMSRHHLRTARGCRPNVLVVIGLRPAAVRVLPAVLGRRPGGGCRRARLQQPG
jgi:hypothetical protein